MKSEQLFQGHKLLLNYVIPINDTDYELNLFTKNLLPTVTEELLLAELSKIANVNSVQLLQEKRFNTKDVLEN